MPSMLEDRDVRWRMRALVRGQLPFLLAVLYLVVALAVAAPHLLGAPWVDVGFGIIIVATIAGVAIPWERLAACWLAVVPILDIGANSLGCFVVCSLLMKVLDIEKRNFLWKWPHCICLTCFFVSHVQHLTKPS